MEKTLKELLKEINDWQDEVFTQATSISAANHLLREAREVFDSVRFHADNLDEELADCFLLVAGVAHLSGVDLVNAIECKLIVNRARQWGKPDVDGVVEHIRENNFSYSIARLEKYADKLSPTSKEESEKLGFKDWEIRMRLGGELPG